MAETERTQFEETPENFAAEEAAFDAATNGTDLEPAAEAAAVEPEAEVLEQEEQEQPEQDTETVAEATEQPAKEVTIADLLAVIETQKTEQQKLRDKVFGKVGELQQKIDAVKPQAGGLNPKAAERLKAEFPELHEMLFGEADDTVDQPEHQVAQVQTVVVPAEDGTRALERRLLTRDHKDWEQVVATDEFASWRDNVLPPEDAEALDDSWDADFISLKLTEFKAYKAGEAKKTTDQQTRQERLNDAITNRGIPRVSTSSLGDDDEEAAMLANFKPRTR